MDTLKIKELYFLDNYKIQILLGNGHSVIYNLEPKLDTIRFTDLKKKELFYCGEVINGKMIRWNTNTEISLEEILQQIINSPIHAVSI